MFCHIQYFPLSIMKTYGTTKKPRFESPLSIIQGKGLHHCGPPKYTSSQLTLSSERATTHFLN